MMKIYFLAFVIVCMMTGCATPKVVEQHHHHYEAIDTQAVEARMDSKMNAWRNEMDSTLRELTNQYSASWSANESEKETITETMTSWIDSLGHEVRQEQRVTNRDISRQQQQTEERITREVEQRLMSVVDSVNGIWQEQFSQYQKHSEQADSTANITTPVTGDNRPWYQRMWAKAKWMLIGALLTVIIGLVIRMKTK